MRAHRLVRHPAAIASALVIAAICASGDARAQPRPRFVVGFGGAAGEGRMILRTADADTRGTHESALALGLRVFAEGLVRRRLSAEVSIAGYSYVRGEMPLLELGVGGRGLFSIRHTEHTFYLRPMLGLAVARPGVWQAGLSFGLAIGYARAVGVRAERFVELGYIVRVLPDVSPSFADATFPSYGFHPEDDATIFAAFLGVTAGIGFGINPR